MLSGVERRFGQSSYLLPFVFPNPLFSRFLHHLVMLLSFRFPTCRSLSLSPFSVSFALCLASGRAFPVRNPCYGGVRLRCWCFAIVLEETERILCV